MSSGARTRGIVIAAAASGAGKTTIASAVCRALSDKGLAVQPFKTGPDFIDPTYLTLGARRECRSLDGFPNPGLIPYFYEQWCASGGRTADIAIVEGVMGLYDGLGPDGLYSTAWLARTLDLPVVLLVDAGAAATSVAAIVRGFASLEPLAPRIVGVVANRVAGEDHAEVIRAALDQYVGIPLLGWLPKMPDCGFSSRHLGLIPAMEQTGVDETVSRFAAAVREHVDLDMFVRLAEAPGAPVTAPGLPSPARRPDGSAVRVAVARDAAFCFYYPENDELLSRLGAEIIPTSPMNDGALPDADVLVLPGGYPEEFARRLADNKSYIESLRGFARTRTVYAECGGMLYLANAIRRGEETFPMTGLIGAEAVMEDRLQRFGYVEATALRDSALFYAGETVRAHEFHYSRMDTRLGERENAFTVRRASGRGGEWADGFAINCLPGGGRLLATYLHINFYSCPNAALRLLG